MFDKVVFAGGGHRCWWQAGFWDVVSSEIELRPRVIGAVSAGAATACLLLGNDTKRALAWYERELAGVRSNVNWLNLFRRDRRLFPHAAIYRKALRALLGGDHFRRLMWHAPEIRVLLTRLPDGMRPGTAVFRGILAYNVEKYVHGTLHPQAGRRLGFVGETRRVQDCRSERELVDLLIASSCTPPFTPLELYDNAPCLDGGLIDNVPVGLVDDVPGSTLVLTTRRYKKRAPVFALGDRLYVQPSAPIPVASWDYTSPKRYQATYALGRKDGEAFLQTFALGRHQDPEQFAGVFLGDAMVAAEALPLPMTDDEPGVPAAAQAASGTEASGEAEPTADLPAAASTAVASDGGEPKGGEPHLAETEVAEPSAAGPVHPSGAVPGEAAAEAAELASEGDAGDQGLDESVRGNASVRLSTLRRPAADQQAATVPADQTMPLAAGAEAAFNANQPAASDGQSRSGRSLRASRI